MPVRLAFLFLLAATLACGRGSQDIEATVNAVNTAVERTLVALTQPAGFRTSTPAASTTPIRIATPVFTPTDFVPPSPTPRPGTTQLPGASPLAPARPNGAVIHARHIDSPRGIDARPDDWPGGLPNVIDQIVFKPENWQGAADQGGHFALAWDAGNLYLFVDLADDVHVQTQHGDVLYRGDSLELQFDADLPGDFNVPRLNQDDHQLGLSPGADRQTPEVYLWNPTQKKASNTGIHMVTAPGPSAGGYLLEAAIPWSMFGITPAANTNFGFALNSSDDDSPGTAEQQSMISTTASRQLLDPTSWGTITLDP